MRPERSMRVVFFVAGTLLLGTPAARGTTWFALDALSTASGLGIEVDTDSLRQTSAVGREIIVRVTYPQPRVHRSGASFRSVVAKVAFHCEGGLGGYREAAFYSDPEGQGLVTARDDGQLPIPERTQDLLPAKSLELITRAGCAQPTPAAR